jgi:uncharacterized membrane protein
MMNNKLLISTALAAVISTGVVAPAEAADKKEKCYGVAKAAQNDCSNLSGSHSCAGQSKVDNDKGEWKLVTKGTCATLGGLLKKEAKKHYKATKGA